MPPSLRHLLYNVLIQPHFDYAFSAWYPNLTKKLKHRIQTTQKFIRFCLQLDKLKHISYDEFLKWLAVTYRFKQCVYSIVFKYFSEQCPDYLNEVFDIVREISFPSRRSFQKLKGPFHKTNTVQLALSYIGPIFWNKISDTLKCTNNLYTFKHNLKSFFE